MSIFRQLGLPSALRRRALEAVGLAGLLAFLPELARARSGPALEPHPGWIAVAILAARDGSAGFFAGLVSVVCAVGIGSAVGGAGLAATFARFDSGPNLIAFGTCLTVSWVASWHLKRQADLRERLRAASDRAVAAEASVETLRDAIASLRARVDRASTSLSFLRDVAARLEGRDPVAAAEGAADLALTRTGASAVAVRVGRDGCQRLLAVRDARGPNVLAPLALHDADRTVPIRDGNRLLGMIALWGIPGSGPDDAASHDLAVIAAWVAPALANGGPRPRQPADLLGSVR